MVTAKEQKKGRIVLPDGSSSTKYQVPTTNCLSPQSRPHRTSILLQHAKVNTAFSTNQLASAGKCGYCFQSARGFTGVFASGNDSRNLFKGRVRDENNCETGHE